MHACVQLAGRVRRPMRALDLITAATACVVALSQAADCQQAAMQATLRPATRPRPNERRCNQSEPAARINTVAYNSSYKLKSTAQNNAPGSRPRLSAAAHSKSARRGQHHTSRACARGESAPPCNLDVSPRVLKTGPQNSPPESAHVARAPWVGTSARSPAGHKTGRLTACTLLIQAQHLANLFCCPSLLAHDHDAPAAVSRGCGASARGRCRSKRAKNASAAPRRTHL